jgi:hypothetical protein
VIKTRRIRWVGHMTCVGEKRNAYRILVGKTEGKSLPERLGCRWEDSIKMDLKEIIWKV